MALKIHPVAGKVLYCLLFCVLLPFVLVAWARATNGAVDLPAVHAPAAGRAAASLGFIMLAWGMINLWIYGKGLPMNAYPPLKLVTQGIYRLTPHPIYVGACLVSIGVSIAYGSSSGLWLVSPVLLIGCIALVLGFEGEDIRARFGERKEKPLLWMPGATLEKPSLWDRISCYVLVFVPWLAVYEAMVVTGSEGAPSLFSTYLPFEKNIPVIEWTEAIYIFTYPFVIILPLVIRAKRHLRELMMAGILATAAGIFLAMVLPLWAPFREFEPRTAWGHLVKWEQAYDSPRLAFPSFHAAWAFIAAHVYSLALPRARLLWWSIAMVIAASCITTGMHSIIDIAGGFLLYKLASKRLVVWRWMQRLSERIANSWKEWRFGGVRVISHAFYAGLAGFTGIFIVSWLLGPSYILPILLIAAVTLVCAGAWAQIVEGATLSRPFGYYGSLIGGLLGTMIVSYIGGYDAFLILAAFSVANPWVQAIGRIRCWVQGCCHGKKVLPSIGIRYTHERSRVCAVSGMKGEYLHNTQLYSIISSIVIGMFMARLWYSDASLPIISGLYLIIHNSSRFVEEAFRGEAQTPYLGRMRLYQWAALAAIILGGIITAIPHTSGVPSPAFSWTGLYAAFATGLLYAFSMGVDFPRSNRRLSRLADN
jgi:protein-S-isoprenylcysteine O-methyltransferase Ste14/membrane-associated phospholipid phosphatase